MRTFCYLSNYFIRTFSAIFPIIYCYFPTSIYIIMTLLFAEPSPELRLHFLPCTDHSLFEAFLLFFLLVLLLCNCQSLDLFKCCFIFYFIQPHFPETCILEPSLPMLHYTQLKWISCHFEHFLETFFSQKHMFVSFAICLATAKYIIIFPASSCSFSTFPTFTESSFACSGLLLRQHLCLGTNFCIECLLLCKYSF